MKIIGTGSALPDKIVTNNQLAEIMDTSDEWISTRTGIRQRHLATTETTTGLSVAAASRALEDAGLKPEELDLIIAATISPDNIVPTLSCQVQAELGATRAFAFDIGAACSGFMYGLATADAYMRTGRVHKALVIGAEILSKMMDWDDRSTCVLFGDGAGAVVVSSEADNFHSIIQGSDGARGQALLCPGRAVNNPYKPTADKLGYVSMDGQAVYKFAVKTVPASIQEALQQAGLKADDIDLYVLHQANIRIIEAVAKRLKQPLEKFPTNLQTCGNISAASVPILLDNMAKDGIIKIGQKIVLSGFGAGLTWGVCVLTY